MNILHLAKMPFSFHDGWDTVVKIHPSVMRSFLLIVLPFSIIAPWSLLYAGNAHSVNLGIYVNELRWRELAAAFFVAELLTVPLMGAVIKNIAVAHAHQVDFKDAYLLAAISAVPMWLSSLGLLFSALWFSVALAFLGLGIAASVLYHGAYSVLQMEDEIEGQSLSYHVFSVGAMVWLILCSYIVLTVLG